MYVVSSAHSPGRFFCTDAQFIRNFAPPKAVLQLDDRNLLHPNNTPWIYYGGSYAGARAAHMRVQYPDLVWGAIASSGA